MLPTHHALTWEKLAYRVQVDMSGNIRGHSDVLWMAAEWSLHSRKTWVDTAMQSIPKWWRALFLSTVHLNGVSTVKERAVAFREQTTSIGI